MSWRSPPVAPQPFLILFCCPFWLFVPSLIQALGLPERLPGGAHRGFPPLALEPASPPRQTGNTLWWASGLHFIPLASRGDEICAVSYSYYWNLIRTHGLTLQVVAVGERMALRPYPLCAVFPNIANTFKCLFLSRKAPSIRLFNKSCLLLNRKVIASLEVSCHLRDEWCSFSARSLIKQAWGKLPNRCVSVGHGICPVSGWKTEALCWEQCLLNVICIFIPPPFPRLRGSAVGGFPLGNCARS